jgi:hypothetical protein
MKTKILVLGFACLSLVAVAQSDKKQAPDSKSHEVQSPRDAASGQATGKSMNSQAKPAVATAREASTGMATGKAAKPGEAQVVSVAASSDQKPPKGQVRVSVGDVNGDGVPDAATQTPGQGTGQNSAINNSHSNIKNTRDAATGQASGKRMHKSITVTKDHDPEPATKK